MLNNYLLESLHSREEYTQWKKTRFSKLAKKIWLNLNHSSSVIAGQFVCSVGRPLRQETVMIPM